MEIDIIPKFTRGLCELEELPETAEFNKNRTTVLMYRKLMKAECTENGEIWQIAYETNNIEILVILSLQ